MEAESAYLSLLGGIESWHLAGERLQLAGPEGELAFAPVPPVETSALIGVDWVLETVIEGDTAASAVAGRRATLRLETDGTLSGSTGCRDLTGRYTVVGGTVVFNEFAAHGECDAALERQDNQVVTVLGDGFRPEIESDRLTVTATDNEALVYRANS
jgi:heat shock protein HslJ